MSSQRSDESSARRSLRASDADRERVVDSLRRHFAAGRLSEDELSDRVEAAYRETTVKDLRKLTADLPSSRHPGSPPSRPGHGALAASVRIHATAYVLVNVFLIAIWAAAGGGYFWPVWPILGWGIGLGMHAAPLLAAPRSGRRRELTAPPAPALDDVASPVAAERPSLEDVASTVAEERPNLQAGAAPNGTVTILFSDIEGSTAMVERLGDVRWFRLLGEHNRIVRDRVRECSGFEVKAQGDGFMIAFPSARRAIECARGIQEAVDEHLGDAPDGPVRVRIGLHTGEAVAQDSDFYGRNVVIAARVAAAARGGEILVSSVVKQLTESAGDIAFDDGREVDLAGLTGTHTLYRVV
jgi:class 3 adenylate cyclase